MMDFETASKCCYTTGSGNAQGSSSGEGNLTSGTQADGMYLRARCLEELFGGQEIEEAEEVTHKLLRSASRRCSAVQWDGITAPAGRVAWQCDKRGDGNSSSSSSGVSSTQYANMETQRVGRLDGLTEDAERTSVVGESQDTQRAVRAGRTQARTSTEGTEAPGQRATGTKSAKIVAPSSLAGGETDASASICSSILWSELLKVSSPANVRAYEELFRCCVSPAASASPASTDKTGNTTQQRKNSAGADHGNASLSRFETLSTQPSHPRLCGDDIADVTPMPLEPLTLTASAPATDTEDTQQHPSACAGNEEHTDDPGTAASERKEKEATLGQLGKQTASVQVATDVAAEKGNVVEGNGLREDSMQCIRKCSTRSLAGGTVIPNVEHCNSLTSFHVRDGSAHDYSASAECGASMRGHSPTEAAMAAVSVEHGTPSHNALMAHVAYAAQGENAGEKGKAEDLTRASIDTGSTEKSKVGTSPVCGGPPAVIRQDFCVVPPTVHTGAETARCNRVVGEGDAVTLCSTPCVVAATTSSSEFHATKVATDENGGEGHVAGAQVEPAYASSSAMSAPRHDDIEERAVTRCDHIGSSAVGDARPERSAASVTEAALTVTIVPAGPATHGENRVPKGGVAAAAEGSAPVGPRGRPSLGAAGRQLLLDRIRAKYHTNVGLYSGVLRKNYNSTISKLPFFTVSLLHQLAADFGIDTNAVLVQQQHQHHYDSARGFSARHTAETGYQSGGRSAPHSRRGAAGNNGPSHLRHFGDDKCALAADTQETSAYSPPADNRRGRLPYENLSRRRCTRRASKKSGSTSDGALASSPGDKGEGVCSATGTRRRSLGLRSNGTSWGPEGEESTVSCPQQRQAELFLIGESIGQHGVIFAPEQDARYQQRNGDKEDAEIGFNQHRGSRGVACMKEETAPQNEAWRKDQAVSAEVSSISTASGTIVRARAVAIEGRREGLPQQSSTAYDGPQCASKSTRTAILEFSGSSVDRALAEPHGRDKWRTLADVALGTRKCGRDQHLLLAALTNLEDGVNKAGRKLSGDVRVLRSRYSDGILPSHYKEIANWSGGASPANRRPSADKTYAGPSSNVHRPVSCEDAEFELCPRDGRINTATIGAAQEKKRSNCHRHENFASGVPGDFLRNSGDGVETLRTQTLIEDGVSVRELRQARYLWSALFGQLSEESGRALRSVVEGEALCRSPGEKCEDASHEAGSASEECHVQLNAAERSPHLTRVKKEVNRTPNIHPAIRQSGEMPESSAAAAGADLQGVGERALLCRGLEWMSYAEPENSEDLHERKDATDGGSGVLAAVSGCEAGIATGRLTEVQQFLEADRQTLDAGHVRKKLKTEVRWPQHEENKHKNISLVTPQPQPAPRSHNTRNYQRRLDLEGCSVVREDRHGPLNELTLKMLTGLEERAAEGVGGGRRGGDRGDAGHAGLLQNASISGSEHGTSEAQPECSREDYKPLPLVVNECEDPVSTSRVRDEDAIPACTGEREERLAGCMNERQKPAFAVRARSICNVEIESRAQTEKRLLSGREAGFQHASVPVDEHACQKHQHEQDSSVVPRQQQQEQVQSGGKHPPAVAYKSQSRSDARGSAGESRNHKGLCGNLKIANKRALADPRGCEQADGKLILSPPSPPPVVDGPPLEPLTTSRISGVGTSSNTPGKLSGCTVEQSASALAVKRLPQQLQQHERHFSLHNRNKLTSLEDPNRRAVQEASVSEALTHVLLSRVAMEGPASEGLQDPYGKRLDARVPDAATSFENAFIGRRASASTSSGSSALRDVPSDTMPLTSILLSSILPELSTETPACNASASAGSRYTSRIVALLQTLSDLQRKLASMQLPPQPSQQQSSYAEETEAGERHLSSPLSTTTPPNPKDRLSPTQHLPDVHLPGSLSSLLPALLPKPDGVDTLGMRQHTELGAASSLAPDAAGEAGCCGGCRRARRLAECEG